jgi:multidrug transporter EmrE-like cation transporter
MNSILPPHPQQGGLPIWYPPISIKWIMTAAMIFIGSVATKIDNSVRQQIVSPLGFFMTCLIAVIIFQRGFPPGAFAVLFMLLMIWMAESVGKYNEGFLNASNTVDWVTNSKKWFVEKVLKEHPVAIQERDVITYPVSGFSSV